MDILGSIVVIKIFTRLLLLIVIAIVTELYRAMTSSIKSSTSDVDLLIK